MTIHYWAFRPVKDPQPGPPPLHLAWTQRIHPTLLQVVYNLLLSQTKVAQALRVSEATPGTREALELDFYQLH